MATPETNKAKKPPNLRAYWEILRPNNIPASFGLVAAGALVASHTAVALFEPKVCSNRKKTRQDSGAADLRCCRISECVAQNQSRGFITAPATYGRYVTSCEMSAQGMCPL